MRRAKGGKDRVTMAIACATRLPLICCQDGYDIRTVQEVLGHRDVAATMIYTHVLNRWKAGCAEPGGPAVSHVRGGPRVCPDRVMVPGMW